MGSRYFRYVRYFRYFIGLSAVFIGLAANSLSTQASEKDNGYQVNTIATGLKSPWALAFLPNKDVLVTERAGSLRVVRDGTVLKQAVEGVPSVYLAGQGGLLDVMLDRNFANNGQIYLSYAYGNRNNNATRLIKARLIPHQDSYRLDDISVLFTAQPTKSTAHHYGARIAQMDDGSILLTVGDGYTHREEAQTLDNHFGKIVRINSDGSVPQDNPFVDNKNALPEIFSLGHRNQQSLLVHQGVIYENEHGPRGGDEVNVINPGNNYGWPVATFGIDYNGATISPFTKYQGMQSPLVDWTPSIAPSGMTEHKGSLYVTSLAEGSIRKLSYTKNQVKDEGIVFPELSGRLRDIVSGPDGNLYVLTDGGNAKIVQIIEQ